jgi:hypothetical protein
MPVIAIEEIYGNPGCIVGWVDIGTRARGPLRVVVYLRKVEKMTKN